MHGISHNVSSSVILRRLNQAEFWRKWHFLQSLCWKLSIFVIRLFIKLLYLFIKIPQLRSIKHVNQGNRHQSNIKSVMRNSHKVPYSLLRMNRGCSKIQRCHKTVNHNSEKKNLDHKWVHAVTVKKWLCTEVYENKLCWPEKYQQWNKCERVN